MLTPHKILEPSLHYLRGHTDELKEMYISATLYRFAQSLIGIFVPIYLYTLHYSVGFILGFLGISYLVRAVVLLPAASFISRHGAKHAILVGYVFNVLFFLSLIATGSYPVSLIAAILFGPIGSALYDTAYDVDFSKSSHDGTRGREIATMYLLNLIAVGVGPLLGGLGINELGFDRLIFVVIILLVLSSLPLFLSPEISKRRSFNLKLVTLARLRRDLFAAGMFDMRTFVSVNIWGLFVYLFISQAAHFFELSRFSFVGLTRTVLVVTSIFSTELWGRIIDRVHRHRVLYVSSLLMGSIEFLRLFVRAPFAALALDMTRGAALPSSSLPYMSLFFQRAGEEPRIEYVYLLQLAASIAIGGTMLVGAGAVLAFGAEVGLMVLLGIGSAASALLWIMR